MDYVPRYEGKSISKLKMDIEFTKRVLILKMLLFFNIISLYTEALVVVATRLRFTFSISALSPENILKRLFCSHRMKSSV